MVLNDKQYARMKQLMTQYLVDNDNYLQLEPTEAITVLQCIIDDETYLNNVSLLQLHKMLSSVNDLRLIIQHDCPQNITLYDDDEEMMDDMITPGGKATYQTITGEYVTESPGILGLSQLNDGIEANVTKSDVVRFIMDCIENETLIQQRILRESDTNSLHQEQSSHTITRRFSNVTEEFWNDALQIIDSTNISIAYYDILDKWSTKLNSNTVNKIEEDLLNYLFQCTVHTKSDIETLLLIKSVITLMKHFNSDDVSKILVECIIELENVSHLTNNNRYRNIRVILYCIRGIQIVESENYEQALKEFNSALALNNSCAMAYVFRGYVHRSMDLIAESISDFTAAIAIYPRCALKLRGILYMKQGNFTQALSDFKLSLKYEPNDVTILNNIGAIYQIQYDHESAISVFNQIVNIYPDETIFIINRAQSKFIIGRINEAIADLDSALTNDPSSTQIYALKATIYNSIGQYNEAVENVRKVISLDPDREEEMTELFDIISSWANIANECSIEQNEQMAQSVGMNFLPTFGFIKSICNILISNFTDQFNQNCLSETSNETKLFWKKIYEPLLETSNLHIELHRVFKILSTLTSLSEGRIQYELRKVLQDTSGEEVYNIKLALILLADSSIESIPLIEECIEWFKQRYHHLSLDNRLKNTLVFLYYYLGRCYGKMMDDVSSVRAHLNFTECILLDPAFARAYAERGIINQKMNNEDALEDYSTAIELDENWEIPYYLRGFLYWYEFKQYEKAIEDITTAIEMDRDSSSEHFSHAATLLAQIESALQRKSIVFENYLFELTKIYTH
jgi:tetratricopeptide (TPR) repeat protein